MSSTLIALSPDLSHLRDEGYEVEVRDDHVLVKNIPYVTGDQKVEHGVMVIALTTSGDRTGDPPDHTVRWVGSMPHHHNGGPIARIAAGSAAEQLAPGLTTQHRFSSKPVPAGKYADYHAQFTAYIRILTHEAQAITGNGKWCGYCA